MNLEDKDGRPWTASTGLGWIVVILVCTCGLAWIALSLYLAAWIRSKGRSLFPLIGYSVWLSLLLAMSFFPPGWTAERTVVLGCILNFVAWACWIAANLSLRRQIISHYREREGWNIEIGLWFTLLFSTVYINYCLNPFDITDNRDTVTSLRISNTADSAKIDL
ncbi:MAG: hypothetical protein V4555_12030 [Acidobacteriota bacterium]